MLHGQQLLWRWPVPLPSRLSLASLRRPLPRSGFSCLSCPPPLFSRHGIPRLAETEPDRRTRQAQAAPRPLLAHERTCVIMVEATAACWQESGMRAGLDPSACWPARAAAALSGAAGPRADCARAVSRVFGSSWLASAARPRHLLF